MTVLLFAEHLWGTASESALVICFWISSSFWGNVFLNKFVLQIFSKITVEHPYGSVIKLLCNFFWNHTSPWEFSCKLATYSQNTLFEEHRWRTAFESELWSIWNYILVKLVSCRNQSIELANILTRFYMINTSFYWKIFPDRL